jgi:hypothetical protein
MGKTPTVGGDFRLCLEETGGGERKDDSEAIVTLLQLLGLSKFLGGTPMTKKRTIIMKC